MLTTFLKDNETLDLREWHKADKYTRLMYPWLPDLGKKTGSTYLLSNLLWPAQELINDIPKGYDTYVLTFQFEYPDFEWIKKFCQEFRDSQVICIYPFNNCAFELPNLSIINIQGWHHVIDWYRTEFGWPSVEFDSKHKKTSALSHRVNQARMYVCAYLHQHWNADDYVMSYHGTTSQHQKDWYLLDYTGHARIDMVIDYIKETFISLRIIPDNDFKNSPINNLKYSWSAYQDCLTNCSNETINCSQIDDMILPGPYLTEKTWKCFLSQTALIPVGQSKTYQYLEGLGFQFDYPWNKDFDQEDRDMVRFSAIFEVLDFLDSTDLMDLKQSIRQSCEFNRDYILSNDFFRVVGQKNEINVQKFYQS